jgi:glutamate/tyrosine decarboxylase-like PLP-dependent enzyme
MKLGGLVGLRAEEETVSYRSVLESAAGLAAQYLDGVRERPVGRPVSVDRLRAALGGPLQNAWTYTASPAGSVAEEVTAGWLIDLLGLPAGASVGFTTGATMANFTALAAARSAVLERVGINVEEEGLAGAPPVAVIVGDAVHATVLAALQMLGLGRERVQRVSIDDQGRMEIASLREILTACQGPTIVCAQAGEVNTGVSDPLVEIGKLTREYGAWFHIDGAFGLWAAASPKLRHLVAGMEQADSWSTDGHKWLNVPYDSGFVFVRSPEVHRQAMSLGAAYYVLSEEGERDNFLWVPDSSRRARGFTVWAALRSLGRAGVRELVERCCSLAQRMAGRLCEEPGVELLNEVVLNQVLVRFFRRDGDDSEAITRKVIQRVQEDGTCWLGGTRWRGRTAARISISNWCTVEADIDRSADAILRCFHEVC